MNKETTSLLHIISVVFFGSLFYYGIFKLGDYALIATNTLPDYTDIIVFLLLLIIIFIVAIFATKLMDNILMNFVAGAKGLWQSHAKATCFNPIANLFLTIIVRYRIKNQRFCDTHGGVTLVYLSSCRGVCLVENNEILNVGMFPVEFSGWLTKKTWSLIDHDNNRFLLRYSWCQESRGKWACDSFHLMTRKGTGISYKNLGKVYFDDANPTVRLQDGEIVAKYKSEGQKIIAQYTPDRNDWIQQTA